MIPDRALELVASYCDILDRLEAIPPSARVRGMFFHNVEKHVARRGKTREYAELFENERHGSLTYYPVREYLVRLAAGGALVASPERVHDGIHEICRNNATFFTDSILGRTLIRLLSHDPIRLSEQGLAARRQTHDYGQWELVRRGPTSLEMIYRDEYVWIESAMAGAAQGTFEACGLRPKIETKLLDRFNGSTLLSWDSPIST